MTEIELFVERLKTVISQEDKDFLKEKIPEDSIEREDYEYRINKINGTYFPKRRKPNEELTLFDDLILDFIYNFKLNDFDIFSIHFYDIDEVGSNQKYILIGSYEGSEIAIHKEDKSIVNIDVDGSVIGKCAKNGKVFLNQLLNLEIFMHQERTLKEKEKFIQENLNILNEETFNFWLTLVGMWND